MNVEHILTLLWTQAWQIGLLWIVIYVLLKAFAGNRPHLGHVLCAVMLIKCVVPPVWSSPIGPFSWIASASQPWLGSLRSDSARERLSSHSENTSQAIRFPHLDPSADWEIQFSDSPGTQKPRNHEISDPNRSIVHASAPPALPWSKVIFGSWLATVAVASLWSLGRYVWFVAWIHRTSQWKSVRVDRIKRELSATLGVRRPFRVIALEASVGPAVVGLLFPVILLPRFLVDRLDDEQLRALIAHEMIHIRRGDLFWSLLQMIANCLWWFHPVVWIVSRRMSQETERSCDEETIASLQCDVGTYARCLLSVLEYKHRLHVAPALPGVRPVQITASRLERIMKMTHGGYRRNPTWMWVALFLLAILLVPGAKLGISQQSAPPALPRGNNPPVKEQLPSVPQARPNSPVPEQPDTPERPAPDTSLVAYEVQELVERIVADGLATQDNAKLHLLEMLKVYKPQPVAQDQVVFATPVNAPTPAAKQVPPQVDGTFELSDGKLVVQSTPRVHKIVVDSIAKYRKYGFKQVMMEFQFIEGPQELSVEGAHWSADKGAEISTLNQQQCDAIHEYIRSHSQFQRLISPRVNGWNGQEVTCHTGQISMIETQQPNQPPVLTEVETGTWLTATPVLLTDNQVQISVRFQLKELWPVQTASTKVASTEFSSDQTIGLGKTFAIRQTITDPATPGRGKCLLTLVKCTESTNLKPQWDDSAYLLDQGDVLGIKVEGLLPAEKNGLAKDDVSLQEQARDAVYASGRPVVVQENGKIALPAMDPLYVRGLSVEQVTDLITNKYMNAKLLKADGLPVTVTILNKRAVSQTTVIPKVTAVDKFSRKVQVKARGEQLGLTTHEKNERSGKQTRAEGSLDFQLEDDQRVSLQGKNLELEMSLLPRVLRVRCDHGELHWAAASDSKEGPLAFGTLSNATLDGHVEVAFNSSHFSCDRFRYENGNIHLQGNVRFVEGKNCSLAADALRIDQSLWTLEGNAKLKVQFADSVHDVHGDTVCWNSASHTVDVKSSK